MGERTAVFFSLMRRRKLARIRRTKNLIENLIQPKMLENAPKMLAL